MNAVVNEVLAVMEPGVLYSAAQLSKLSERSSSVVQSRLNLALSRRLVERVSEGERSLYRIPVLNVQATPGNLCVLPRRELKWESEWRRFRALCEATRR
jgi:hypothetical protein